MQHPWCPKKKKKNVHKTPRSRRVGNTSPKHIKLCRDNVVSVLVKEVRIHTHTQMEEEGQGQRGRISLGLECVSVCEWWRPDRIRLVMHTLSPPVTPICCSTADRRGGENSLNYVNGVKLNNQRHLHFNYKCMHIETPGHTGTPTHSHTICKYQNLEVLSQVNWSASKVNCSGLWDLCIYLFLRPLSYIWNTSRQVDEGRNSPWPPRRGAGER